MKDLAIDGILENLDRQLSDLEETCDHIEAWIETHRSRESGELIGTLDTLERSSRSELFTLSAFVDDLPTPDTRSRVVPPEMAS